MRAGRGHAEGSARRAGLRHLRERRRPVVFNSFGGRSVPAPGYVLVTHVICPKTQLPAFLAELVELSGIVAVLFAAIGIRHWGLPNLQELERGKTAECGEMARMRGENGPFANFSERSDSRVLGLFARGPLRFLKLAPRFVLNDTWGRL